MKKFGLSMGIAAIIFLVVLPILGILLFDVTTIEGNQIGVMETYTGGVVEQPYLPRTYFVLPWERLYVYDISQKIYVMNDKEHEDENGVSVGRQNDSYHVQSLEGQDLTISMNIQWRIDPKRVIDIHRGVRNNIEERVLRPTLLRVVKDEATQMMAIDAYSGSGLVKLQTNIERNLSSPENELYAHGVIVDNFVIEHISLDAEYLGEIKKKQVAQQRELRAVQEEKAAQSEALKVKAEAQAEKNKAIVKAEQEKEVLVLQSQAEKEKQVLSAQAEKESSELRAEAIIAIGKANAEAEKLKFAAYSAEGADLYAKIQIAESMSNGIQNVKGYLPENMTIFTIGESFQSAVEKLVKPQ